MTLSGFPDVTARLARVALLAALLAPGAEALQEPLRGVVLLLADDVRHDALSATGNPYLATPNLDRIAEEGIVFERSFVTTSMCCPSRASLLTGLYAHETGVHSNQTGGDFPGDLATFPALLQAAGFRTAFIGKWHMPNPGAQPVEGFDRWVSFEDQGVYFHQELNVDGKAVATRGFSADVLTDYALEWIRRDDERPFCLILSYKNCHLPFVPPARHRGLLADEAISLPTSFGQSPSELPGPAREARLSNRNRGPHANPELYQESLKSYWELLFSIDESAGRVLSALEEIQVLDETLVIFTSDNGYMVGEHGLSQKRLSYEPSIRVPLAMRYPPSIAGGKRSRSLVLNVDLAATILSVANVGEALAGGVFGAGRSLVPLFGDPRVQLRDAFLYVAPWTEDAPAFRELGLRTARYKFLSIRHADREGRAGRVEEVLFDLREDPGETRNLVGDDSRAAVLSALESRMGELREELSVPSDW